MKYELFPQKSSLYVLYIGHVCHKDVVIDNFFYFLQFFPQCEECGNVIVFNILEARNNLYEFEA